jgi:hypothetical protein
VDLRELRALEIAAKSKLTFDGTCWTVSATRCPFNHRADLRLSCEPRRLGGVHHAHVAPQLSQLTAGAAA